MKQIFRVTILIHDVAVLDRFFEGFDLAENWALDTLKQLDIEYPEEIDFHEAFIVPVKGVVL